MTKQEADHILAVVTELLALHKHNAQDAEPEIRELIERCTNEE